MCFVAWECLFLLNLHSQPNRQVEILGLTSSSQGSSYLHLSLGVDSIPSYSRRWTGTEFGLLLSRGYPMRGNRIDRSACLLYVWPLPRSNSGSKSSPFRRTRQTYSAKEPLQNLRRMAEVVSRILAFTTMSPEYLLARAVQSSLHLQLRLGRELHCHHQPPQ